MRKPRSARAVTKAPMRPQEIWKPVPGWEGLYEVSNRGAVRSLRGKGRILKPQRGSKGKGRADAQYPRVVFKRTVDGEHIHERVRVHRLVWSVFRGPIPEGLEVNHKDLDRANAALSNLELLTRKANLAHARAWRAAHPVAVPATMGMAV